MAGPTFSRLSRSALLDMRMCDLELSFEGTALESLINRVCAELGHRGIVHRPHFWLADEWFSPDGTPGVGVPFYLAHKRLARLERATMFEVEGGTRRECMMILRHEVGHAIDTAYRLSRRRKWRTAFGPRSKPYPEYYRPRPSSKRFVQHLPGWYAQSHPVEDFAETFAVWLDPRSRWRTRYRHWPAFKKLTCVDEMMRDLAGRKALVTSRARPYSLAKLRRTLRTHYRRKRAHYDLSYSEAYDRDLKRLFSEEPGVGATAASLIRRRRRLIRERVSRWTGAYEVSVDQLLRQIIGRCQTLKLRVACAEEDALNEFTILLAVQTTQHLRTASWHAM